MTSMIERVARAIAAKEGKEPDALSHNSFHWWRHYVPHARSAIEAMRELSPDHVVAIYRATTKHMVTSGEEYWEAGINAALKEPTT